MANFIITVRTGSDNNMIVSVPALNIAEAVKKFLESDLAKSNGIGANNVASLYTLPNDQIQVISWGSI